MNFQKTSFLQLIVLALLLSVIAQMIHESGHLLVYQAYERGPVWGFIGLVQLWDTPPLQPTAWVETSSADGQKGWLRLSSPANSKLEELLEAAGGPLASLMAAILGLLLLRQSRELATRQAGLMLSLVSSLVMSLYYLRSPFRVGGDEYSMALHLGLAKAEVEVPFAIAFITCLLWGFRELKTGKIRLKWLAAILLGSIPAGLALNLMDAMVRSQVNQGDPLFLPVFGFSFPVVMVNSLCLFGIWLWWRSLQKTITRPR